MANEEHLAILKQGVEAWNRWRDQNPRVKPDLENADLSYVTLYYNTHDLLGNLDLEEANLSNAVLRNANLTGRNLQRANFRGADMREAQLGGVWFGDADFRGADLRNAQLIKGLAHFEENLGGDPSGAMSALVREVDEEGGRWSVIRQEGEYGWHSLPSVFVVAGVRLRPTSLVDCRLDGTDLRYAVLNGTRFSNTIFANLDLSQVIGLDTCTHYGPSIIDHRTLAKSGKLPLAFLHGCGLPDAFIEYLPSLLNEPIQLYSVFISYSHQDEAFAQRLYDALQGKGVRCWYAPEDIQGGKKLHEQIDEAIRVYDKLLLILSEHSMQSEWVKTEIANARRREVTQKRQILFPIRLVDYETIRSWICFDADTGKDSAREIREYFIPDFSNWKDHDAFEHAFARLLHDLKADAVKTST